MAPPHQCVHLSELPSYDQFLTSISVSESDVVHLSSDEVSLVFMGDHVQVALSYKASASDLIAL